MAIVKKSLGFIRGDIVLNDDGTFKACFAFKRVGYWDDVKLAWDIPPFDSYAGEYTLPQLKTFIANLT